MKKMVIVFFLVVINLFSYNGLAQSPNLAKQTQEALIAAIDDERHAQAVYQAVINKYGDIRPFINIIQAERRHESALLILFEKYNVPVPQNTWSADKIAVPKTITTACEMGILAEKANIAMYNRFLDFVKESDIRSTFINLQSASKDNHLRAFHRCTR